jgi:amino acid transporter
VLSFLGFDAISTLAEETRGGTRLVGQATMMALCLAAVLFIAQTYIAVLLVPDRTESEETLPNAHPSSRLQ